MFSGQLIFAQLMEFVPRHEFNACVERYRGDYRARGFSCRNQCWCMAFAQLTFRESLRDIETCLRSVQPKLYHAGIRGRVSRSTLGDANRRLAWQIYADMAHVLIARARQLYARESFGVTLEHVAYALDATTIDLCLSLIPGAPFRRAKAAVKLHTLLDLRGSIPTFIRVSSGKMHEVNVLDELWFEPGAFYTEHTRKLVFLTNSFTLPPLVIAELYRCRWQVQLFFKWIKQHLPIKAFYGTSQNAVKTQV